MSLLSRIERTLGAPPAAQPPAASAPAAFNAGTLGPALARLGRPRPLPGLARRDDPGPLPPCFGGAPLPFADALGHARSLDTPEGTVWSLRSEWSLDTHHGEVALGRGLRAPFGALAAAIGDSRLFGFDPSDALFLDLETTGLEHGGGNVAFLVAAGWFERDRFVLEQLVLRDASSERALLHLAWRWLGERSYLVSFNGKSFDLTILQNRLVMHRFSSEDRAAVKLRPHLDLLHVSRALFKGLFADTRLQTLERELVGFHRADDMPGALAPACYFAWLRQGHAGPLARIAHHNLDDVLTMVALAALLAETAPAGPHLRELPAVALNLASRHLRMRQPEAALAIIASLAGTDLEPTLEIALGEIALTAARRLGQHDLAAVHASVIVAHLPDHGPALRALKRAGRAG